MATELRFERRVKSSSGQEGGPWGTEDIPRKMHSVSNDVEVKKTCVLLREAANLKSSRKPQVG